ncbi:hypothetical protein B0H67DRAFT_644163 [Lasiosphaeris hirsuta]|uniref:Uncharacterized protein n=1 Tax=Lasiosphaeris hirsuta TaxID=260670 RepID=A0AA40AS53_9PEZI|nr:hypothetical protein B0H67DRAFT_644163 [Lasiosphaeris hirsuta]
MAPLKMIITVIVMMLAALLGSKQARRSWPDRWYRPLPGKRQRCPHQIEDNVRPPFPTAWFQVTLVIALVWMLAPLLVNLWDAIIRGSKRLDKFIHLFRDHHTTVRHQTMVQAITSLGSVFTEDAVVQARRQRDDAIESRKKIEAAKSLVDVELKGAIIERDAAVAAKSLVDVELEAKASSLKKAEADLEKVRAKLSCAKIGIGRLMEAAEDRASQAKQEMLKRLDDIENRTKKLEEDAVTMAKK